MKILITVKVSSVGPERLKADGYEVLMGTSTEESELIKLVEDVDAMIVTNTPVTEKLLSHTKKLKIVSKHGIGVNNIDIDACTRRGVYVTNCPMAAANAVAEHAVMLMLSIGKDVRQSDIAVRSGRFTEYRTTKVVPELEGQTLGLVGVGHIGNLVAKKAAYGFGMHVIAYDPYVDPGKLDPCVTLCPELDHVAERADFISLHMPLTPSTKGMIGKAFFDKMKATACLINTARGAVTDEEELIEALKDGTIRGAALDVFAEEAIDEKSPFCQLPNVILTPHFAAMTDGAVFRMSDEAARHVEQVLNGSRPDGLVNKNLVIH